MIRVRVTATAVVWRKRMRGLRYPVAVDVAEARLLAVGARHPAQKMVERAVFHHHDDHVRNAGGAGNDGGCRLRERFDARARFALRTATTGATQRRTCDDRGPEELGCQLQRSHLFFSRSPWFEPPIDVQRKSCARRAWWLFERPTSQRSRSEAEPSAQ